MKVVLGPQVGLSHLGGVHVDDIIVGKTEFLPGLDGSAGKESNLATSKVNAQIGRTGVIEPTRGSDPQTGFHSIVRITKGI